VNASGRAFLTSCRLEGRLVIRVCLLGFRVDATSVAGLLELLCEEAAAII
jgi:hypothetical protein